MNSKILTPLFTVLLGLMIATISHVASVNADVERRILDDSQAPVKTIRLTCSAPSVEELVAECGQTLRNLCPHGGVVSDLEETPEGIAPIQIRFVVKCDTSRDEI